MTLDSEVETGSASLAIRVGGVGIGLAAESADVRFSLPPPVALFGCRNDEAEVSLRVVRAEPGAGERGPARFVSGGAWKLFEDGSSVEILLYAAIRGPDPFLACRLGAEWSSGAVLLHPTIFPAGAPAYPLAFPLDELLVMRHVCRGGGLEVHACGIALPDGDVVVLAGESGAGKSTLARVWSQSCPGCRILSDDRIVLRPAGTGVEAWGTPWHGDAGFCDPHPGRLAAIYFLTQATQTRVRSLGRGAATARLLACSFLPFYDAGLLAQAAEAAEGFVRGASVRELAFTPDDLAVRAVLADMGR